MPIIKSARKRAKQANIRHERNIVTKKAIKEATKAFLAKPSAEGLSKAQSELDKAVKKGLIKKNTAARRKSALVIVAKKAGIKLVSKKTPKTPAKTIAKKPVSKAATKKPAAKSTTAKKTPAKSPAAKKTPAKKATTAKKTTK